jgi:hypothetical protein
MMLSDVRERVIDILPGFKAEDSRIRLCSYWEPRLILFADAVEMFVASPGSWADTDDLVLLQANQLTAGCAKQPLLQKPPVGFGRYLLYIGANYDATDFC